MTAPILITSGQKQCGTTVSTLFLTLVSSAEEWSTVNGEENHQRWKDREQSMRGGGWREQNTGQPGFSHWMHLKFFRNFDAFFSHSWGLLPERVLQKRFRHRNPLLPEKWREKRTGQAQLIVLYTGIRLTCSPRPVSTRHGACRGQCVWIWGGWGVDYKVAIILSTLLTTARINVGVEFRLLA